MKLLLGHGASGSAAQMRPWVDALAPLGVDAIALTLPRGNPREKSIEVFRRALVEHPGAAIGGHSFGGRMASMLAAEQDISRLVLLSYPLHPPGQPEKLRTEHWPAITCPVLMLSGDRDEFSTLGLLRTAVGKLTNAELVIYPGVGHGLTSVIGDASGRIARFCWAANCIPDEKVPNGLLPPRQP